MNLEALKALRKALRTVCTDMAQDAYTGCADTYLIYNDADETPSSFVDDEASTETSYIQVHLYLPNGRDYMSLKKKIKTALVQGGFSYPSVSLNTVESDTDKRHICFETNIESEV